MQRILRLERNNIQKVRIARNGIQCHNILAFYHEPEKKKIFFISIVYFLNSFKCSNKKIFELFMTGKFFLRIKMSQNKAKITREMDRTLLSLTYLLVLFNSLIQRACPLILFKKKNHPIHWFSCNILKIFPYKPVLRVGWIFHPTRLFKPNLH